MGKKLKSKKIIYIVDKFRKFIKKEHPYLQILEICTTIIGVTIITIIQVILSVWSNTSVARINMEEEKVEKIKVTQSYEYIESILGKPYTKNTYLFPVQNGNYYITGSKVVFCLEFSTLIAYFDEDDSLFGYFLISENKNFKPKQYKDMNLFGKKLLNLKEDIFCGYKIAISCSSMSRRDGSSHFMKYYYHDLATNDCIVGVGISSLGYHDNVDFFSYVSKNEENFIDNSGGAINYDQGRFVKIDNEKCNTFSIFIGGGDIDTLSFLKKETYLKMGLTDIEFDRLKD